MRLRVPDQTITFIDHFAGAQLFDLARGIGDFVIAKGDATPAYQLAVVVDDADAGVSDVVRGDDLLDSAARQILLYEKLNLGPPPQYWHLPLVIGPDGRRLAKRHGDTRVASYRERGVSASAIVQLLASWCGIDDAAGVSRPADLIGCFDITKIPRQPIVFDPAHVSL